MQYLYLFDTHYNLVALEQLLTSQSRSRV